MKAKFFYIATLVFVFIFTASLSATAQNSKEQTQTTTESQKQKTIKIKVSGITCAGDCKDIQKVVAKMNGVSSVKQIGKPTATSVFEISFDPALISEKDIRKVVEDTPGCDNPEDRPYKVKKG